MWVGLLLLVASCGKVREFEYKGVSNIKLNVQSKPSAKADIRFFNPNNFSARLRSAEVEVLIAGKKAGEVIQEYDVAVPRKSEFTVPVEVALSLRDFSLMGALSGIMSGKPFPVQLKGKVQVVVHGVPVRIPVDHTEEIRLGK